MEILVLLIPLSVLLLGLAAWAFIWAVNNRQFDDLDYAGVSASRYYDQPLPCMHYQGLFPYLRSQLSGRIDAAADLDGGLHRDGLHPITDQSRFEAFRKGSREIDGNLRVPLEKVTQPADVVAVRMRKHNRVDTTGIDI